MSERGSTTGLDLSESYYRDVVKPLLKSHFPSMPISAGLIGDGSEILGFDTEMSQDHDWGPRVMVFLHESDHAKFGKQIALTVGNDLPKTFSGFATQFTTPNQIAEIKSTTPFEKTPFEKTSLEKTSLEKTSLEEAPPAETLSISRSVEFHTVQTFFGQHLNFDLTKEIEPADWLTFPEQKLATIIGGRIFDDEVALQETRARFRNYPHDVWLYLLACQWTRIEQEEHLMGRAGYVGDELGSAIIAARLVRDLIRLCFLMERQYAPYPKWFGTAFARLKSADIMAPLLSQVLTARTWEERQQHLCRAYEFAAVAHNELKITEPLPTSVRQFHDRPFSVISMGDFSKAVFSRIEDPKVCAIAAKRPIGSIDQFSDNTDLLSDARWRSTIRTFYD